MIARMGDRHGDLVIRDLERSEVAGVWSIDRTEWIDRVYHVRDGELVLEAEHYDVRDWPPGEADEYGPRLLDCFDRGGSCLGAFDGDTLVGAVVLESRFIGEYPLRAAERTTLGKRVQEPPRNTRRLPPTAQLCSPPPYPSSYAEQVHSHTLPSISCSP